MHQEVSLNKQEVKKFIIWQEPSIRSLKKVIKHEESFEKKFPIPIN